MFHAFAEICCWLVFFRNNVIKRAKSSGHPILWKCRKILLFYIWKAGTFVTHHFSIRFIKLSSLIKVIFPAIFHFLSFIGLSLEFAYSKNFTQASSIRSNRKRLNGKRSTKGKKVNWKKLAHCFTPFLDLTFVLRSI